MIPTSLHQQIEQALANALLIQGSLQTGASDERMDGTLADDDAFLEGLMHNPGILELVRDLMENEDTAGVPMSHEGGFEQMIRRRLQMEIRTLAKDTADEHASA